MEKPTLISFVIPCYYSQDTIRKEVEAVIEQFEMNEGYDYEFILVNDGSTDESKKILYEYADKDGRVKIVENGSNIGLPKSLNNGISHCTGEYIARMDTDDVCLPFRLEKQIAFMQTGNYPISCTSYFQINMTGGKNGRFFYALEKVDYERLLLDCPVGNSSVIYDVSQIGIQTVPNIRKRSDDALWLQILKITPYIWGLKDVLMIYRTRESSLSANKIKLIKYHWILYRQIEKMNVVSSMFHIIYWGLIKITGIK